MDRGGTCPWPREIGPWTSIQVAPALPLTLTLAWPCSITGSTIFGLKLAQYCMEPCVACVEMLITAPLKALLRLWILISHGGEEWYRLLYWGLRWWCLMSSVHSKPNKIIPWQKKGNSFRLVCTLPQRSGGRFQIVIHMLILSHLVVVV